MKTIGIPLTGSKHLAHDIALQSGHTNFLFLGSAMNPEEHYHKKHTIIIMESTKFHEKKITL